MILASRSFRLFYSSVWRYFFNVSVIDLRKLRFFFVCYCWCFADVNLFKERDRENSFFVLLIFIRTSANFGSKKFCDPFNTSADIGVGSFCCSVRIFLHTDCGRLRVPLYVTPQHGCFYHCVEYRGNSCRSAFVSVPQVPSTIGLKRYRRKKKILVVKILRRHSDQRIVMEFYLSFLPHRQTTRLLFGFTLLQC